MTHNPTMSPALLLLALAAFAALWCLSLVTTAKLTGWAALARRFRSHSEPYGDARSVGPWLLTVYTRYWTHYSGIVKMTAAGDALYLSILFMFRPGHPPLCIPWSELAFARTKYFFRRYVVLTLGNQEKIPLRISERAARKLGLIERMVALTGPEQPPPLQ